VPYRERRIEATRAHAYGFLKTNLNIISVSILGLPTS
jgi:hypothetical protein